ncbi:ABC transporter substrate-binding protein, partial [Ralstonia pseudosolanacearum]
MGRGGGGAAGGDDRHAARRAQAPAFRRVMAAVRPRLTALMAAAVLMPRAGLADVVTVAQVLPFAGQAGSPIRAAADAAALYLRKASRGDGVNGHVIRV